MKTMSLRSRHTIDQSEVRLSALQPVRWNRLRVDRPVAAHDHEFTEICLVLKGRAIHVTEGGRAPLYAGHVIVMPPGRVHAFEKPSGLEVINIYFLPEWFLPELRLERENDGVIPLFFASSYLARPLSAEAHHFELPEATLASVLRELEDIGDAAAPRWVACCFFKVLLLLASSAWLDLSGRSTAPASLVTWRALAEIDRIVQAGGKLDLASLARSLGFGRDHLGKIFRREVGTSPKTFHQRRRLQLACRLLLNEQWNLAEIASHLGYADEAHLCRLFRREYRITPKDYRRKFASLRNQSNK